MGELLVVVDAANVVGARPDGWWRDRPGAARRLYDRLVALAGRGLPPGTLPGDPAVRFVLVVEGAARAGVPAGGGEGGGTAVEVVHADGDGDDALLARVRAHPGRVLAVTADRALRSRLAAAGADVTGPGWLWDLLDAAAGGGPARR
ncbi:MAG TPA: hypothetical protein VKP11_08915 [Frankiaceae bacterium]|nr:hypothetical protein [Frankiaceae bacterium]